MTEVVTSWIGPLKSGKRRRLTVAQKHRIVAETREPGQSVSAVARRHSLSTALVFRWRRELEGPRAIALRAAARERAQVRDRLLERVKQLETMLGRKVLECERLRETVHELRAKCALLSSAPAPGTTRGPVISPAPGWGQGGS